MLLNIYLGTIVINWGIKFIVWMLCQKKLKEEGYQFVDKKKFLLKKSLSFSFFATLLKDCLPIYHILNTIAMLSIEKQVYNYVKDILLEEGSIYKFEENKAYKEKNLIYTIEISKEKRKKVYDTSRLEEKIIYLQQEKEALINQATAQVESPFVLSRKRTRI